MAAPISRLWKLTVIFRSFSEAGRRTTICASRCSVSTTWLRVCEDLDFAMASARCERQLLIGRGQVV